MNFQCGLFLLLCSIVSKLVDSSSLAEPKSGMIERFRAVLQEPIAFTDEEEQEQCERLVGGLTKEELLVAARTSYAFWYTEQHSQSCVSSELIRRSALREARRHLAASNGDLSRALERVKDVCRYRQEHHLDLLRASFEDTSKSESIVETGGFDEMTDFEERKKKMRDLVSTDMYRQAVILVSGNSQTSSAVLLKGPRGASGATEEEYLTTQFYIVERANACLEYTSLGREEKLVSVLDFSNFQSSNSPPMSWQIAAIRKLQLLYPERMRLLIIVGPPFWMRGLLRGVKALLPKSTQERIEVARDRTELAKILGIDEILDTMDELDMNYYLNEVAVYCPYNNSTCQQGILATQ